MIVKLLCFVSQAETRAEFAERSVAKLEKTIDDLEGIQHFPTFLPVPALTPIACQLTLTLQIIATSLLILYNFCCCNMFSLTHCITLL